MLGMSLDKNLTRLLQQQETGLCSKRVSRQLSFSPTLVRRLRMEHEQKGHGGCVNRIAWNDGGSLLASGSDDVRVMIWSFPDVKRQPIELETLHQANIFGVRFLPCSGDRKIVTGAMDHSVQLHDLERCPAHIKRESRASTEIASTHKADMQTTQYNYHRHRVKSVEVEPLNPFLFWSASEDGTIRQFDTRCSYPTGSHADPANVVVAVHKAGWSPSAPSRSLLELKSISINKVKPWQMAVACLSPEVRIFDRRKLQQVTHEDCGSYGPEPMLRLAPPHMALAPHPQQHSTHVVFSNWGDKILTTYHQDHAYAFDVTSGDGYLRSTFQRIAASARVTARMHALERSAEASSSGGGGPARVGLSAVALPAPVALLRKEGNEAAFSGDVDEALHKFNEALKQAPWAPILYVSRAASFLERGWAGDTGKALKDADLAVALDPDYQKAHEIRIKSLRSLGQLRTALSLTRRAQERFKHSDVETLTRLAQAIKNDLAERCERDGWAPGRRTQGRRSSSSARSPDADTPSPGRSAAQPMAVVRARSPPSGSTRAGQDADNARGDGVCEETGVSQEMGSTALESPEAEQPACSSGMREAADDGVSFPATSMLSETEASDSDGEQDEERLCRYLYCNCSSSERQLASLWMGTPGGRRQLASYVGHCNVQTDIKEASYLGGDDALVACGSDDGYVYIYDAASGEPVWCLQADESVVNCVQAHPHLPLLATSGIEDTVKLWTPCDWPQRRPDLALMRRLLRNRTRTNQASMKEGPFLLRHVNPQVLDLITRNPDLLSLLVRNGPEESDPEVSQLAEPATVCRVS